MLFSAKNALQNFIENGQCEPNGSRMNQQKNRGKIPLN